MNEKLQKLEKQQAELQQKQDKIKARIRAIKSKEKAEKRKKATHYKILLGAYVLNTFIQRGEVPLVTSEQLRNFLNDDNKFREIKEFISDEIKNYSQNN